MAVRFIDDHRGARGVEPTCRVLAIAPSTYYEHRARQADPERLPARARRDAVLRDGIRRARGTDFEVHGSLKVWRELNREGMAVARCTVERPTRDMGLQGAVGGKEYRTTTADDTGVHPADLVMRDFTAACPSQVRVADLTCVATRSGSVGVAFVIDAFSRAIVGWRVSSSLRSDLALDALEQALRTRPDTGSLVHHSDCGVQHLSIRCTERLKGTGIEPSVGSVGDFYDNALGEPVIGLYKTEVIRRRGSCVTSTRSSSQRWSRSTRSATVGCSIRSDAYRLWSLRRRTTGGRRSRPWWPESHSRVSGRSRAVQAGCGDWVIEDRRRAYQSGGTERSHQAPARYISGTVSEIGILTKKDVPFPTWLSTQILP